MITQAQYHSISRFAALVGLIGLSACSTVIEGRSQTISVNSSPEGAQCTLKEADEVVGRLTTPGNAEVRKSKNDLMILCYKEGYDSVAKRNHSDYAISSLGNMVLGQYGFVGNAVDSLSGAANKYDSTVFVTLARSETPVAFPAPPGAPPVLQLAEQTTVAMSMQVPMPGAQIGAAKSAATEDAEEESSAEGAGVKGFVTAKAAFKPTAAVSNDAPYIKEARAVAAPVEGVETRTLAAASSAPLHAPKLVAALDTPTAAAQAAPAISLAPRSAYPAIKASAQMAKAADAVYARAQPQVLSYAQAEAEMTRRPPFDITQ